MFTAHDLPLKTPAFMKVPNRDDIEVYNRAPPCGVPGSKRRISIKDVSLLIAQLAGLAAGMLTVFLPRLAIYLGQVNQLIVVGFLLAIMALCLESQAKSATLIFAGSRTKCTIQDLDALMRKDLFASRINVWYRLFLLLILALPLSLSVSYKTFIGGFTTITIDNGPGMFGYATPPGNQLIGNGISICAIVYVPFLVNPAINQTYGFNLYIADNETAAIVDTPFRGYLAQLQSSLGDSQSLSLKTTVNATVSQMVNPTAEQRESDEYWAEVQARFIGNHSLNDNNGAYSALWAGMRPLRPDNSYGSNFSVFFLSNWNTSNGETFESEAIRTEQTRRLAEVEWLITSSNTTLKHVSLLPESIQSNQLIIQDDRLSLQSYFGLFPSEYVWHGRAGSAEFPYPGGTTVEPRWYQPVNTVPALSAAMLWARITSLNGDGRPPGALSTEMISLTGYEKTSKEIITTKTYPTLRRSPLLAIVLLINPLLYIICTVIKVSLHKIPIGDNFNSISMLAAVRDSDLMVLKGAALTGVLRHKIHTAFAITADDDQQSSMGYQSIKMSLGKASQSQRIKDKFVYG